MAQFASALFTAADGTTLATADANFSVHPVVAGLCQIAANRVRPSSTTSSAYIHSGGPATADYTVAADLVRLTADIADMALIGRADATANTMYRLAPSGSNVQLHKFVAGAATQLGVNTAAGFNVGVTIAVKLEMIGSAIKVFSDGLEKISVTDTAITAAGKAGVRSFSSATPSDTVGVHLDNFSADDVGGGVSFSSATTDGADVLASNVSVSVALSSATTDGADVLAGAVSPVVGTTSSTTDGADVLASSVSPVIGTTSETTDGADVLASTVSPVIGTTSATTDGADVLAASAVTGTPIAVELGGGIKRKKDEKKQYLVDGILRNLSDAEVAQIMSQPSTPEKPAKKIVLEDKAPLTKGLKEWKIEPAEVASKQPTKVKPVFAKETLKVEDERIVVKVVEVDDTEEEDAIIKHLLARRTKQKAILTKHLTKIYTHLMEEDQTVKQLLAKEMERRSTLSKSLAQLTQLYAHLTGGR